MKLNKPKISNCVEKSILDALNENEFNNCYFNTNTKEKITISNNTFDTCIFENIDFTNVNLNDVDLIDVIFDGCDLCLVGICNCVDHNIRNIDDLFNSCCRVDSIERKSRNS